MVRQQLDAVLEWAIFAVLLGILCFGPLATGAVRAVDFLVLQAATMLLMVLWAVRCWVSRESRMLWPPICWAVVAFVAYAIVRYWTAEIEYTARQELIRILVYAGIFFVALNNILRRESVQWLSIALVLLATGISVYAIYQWGTKSHRIWNFIQPPGYAGRGSGTYICPNHLAGFLELLLPLGLACTLAGRGSTLFRLLLGYASLVMAAGLAVSQSFAGMAAAGASLLLFFVLKIQNRHYRWPALAFLALLVGAGLFVVTKTNVISRRFDQTTFTHEYGSGTIRNQIYLATVAMWRDHPWTGVGPAHFDHRFPQYRLATPSVQNRPDRVHNDWLNTLVDWGLVGFTLVLSAWLLLFWGVIRVWKYVQRPVGDLAKQSEGRSTTQSNRTAFVVGATVGLVALLLHSLFDFNLHIPANAILTVTLMAVLSAHGRFATDRWWRTPVWTRSFATLLALAGVVYLGSQAWGRANETRWLIRADRADEPEEARLAALKNAFAAEARNADTAGRIGEILRLKSWDGGDDYQTRAKEAIGWFERATQLNRYDAYFPLRHGMCLVWLGQAAAATPYFERAARLDPNSYYTVAHLGWHQFHVGNYPQAKEHFDRSLKLTPYGTPNPVARSYLELMERRLKEPPSLLQPR